MAILFTTRTLLDAEAFDLGVGLSFTGAEDLALPKTMLFGFLGAESFDFAGVLTLLLDFTAIYNLDSF